MLEHRLKSILHIYFHTTKVWSYVIKFGYWSHLKWYRFVSNLLLGFSSFILYAWTKTYPFGWSKNEKAWKHVVQLFVLLWLSLMKVVNINFLIIFFHFVSILTIALKKSYRFCLIKLYSTAIVDGWEPCL